MEGTEKLARMSAETRREKLVEAAIRVMVRDGVTNATTRSIVAEADMTLGVFHYAFRSKQELMEQVSEAVAKQSRAEINAAMFVEGMELVDIVRAGLHAYFDHVVAHPQEHLMAYELTYVGLRDPELGDVAKRQYDYYLSDNKAMILALAEFLGIEFTMPVDVVNRYIFSLVDGLALNYLAIGEETQAREVLDHAATTFLTMVRPRA
jgi:AcrR family transcriptional regulator